MTEATVETATLQTEPPAAPTVDEQTVSTGPTQLPDDHPLVKTLAAQKEQLRELKAKASRLDEIEEATKTEAQRQVELVARLTAENETLKVATQRAQVAASKGVDPGLLQGGTEEEMIAFADRLLAFKGTPVTAASSDGQGNVGGPVTSGEKQLTREELAKLSPADRLQAAADGHLKNLLKT